MYIDCIRVWFLWEDFILGNVGIHMTESFYDAAINEKYNLR